MCGNNISQNALYEDLLTKAPLAERLRRARLSERSGFHMPGHAGGEAFPASFRRDALCLDTTETPLSDNLLAPLPGGAVAAAEAAAAAYWRAGAAVLLAQGSTQGLQAMLLHYVGKQGRLLITGPVHKAVRQAAALLDIELLRVPVEAREAADHPAAPPAPPLASARELAAFLAKGTEGCRAFLCTSPDYYGQEADLAAYAAVLAPRGLPFLLDAAHGAHLTACREAADGGSAQAAWPVTAAVMSLHKTLPALTGAAVLLCREAGEAEALRRAADIWGSSSPSLLIAASADYARAYAQYLGAEQARRLRAALADFTAVLPAVYGLNLREPTYQGDPLRVVIDVSEVTSGPEAEKFLLERGVVPEMADLCRLVLIVPLALDPEALRPLPELFRALAEKPRTPSGERLKALDRALADVYRRQQGTGPRAALLDSAAGQGPKWREAAHLAAGGCLAADIVPYPPGVPLWRAGEELTPADGLLLAELAAAGLSLNGCREEDGLLLLPFMP